MLFAATGCALKGEIKLPGTQDAKIEAERERTKQIQALVDAVKTLAAAKATPSPEPTPEVR
mgnify:CR=1 FL=1